MKSTYKIPKLIKYILLLINIIYIDYILSDNKNYSELSSGTLNRSLKFQRFSIFKCNIRIMKMLQLFKKNKILLDYPIKKVLNS